ncbi:MAG: DUF2523 domain-containing protein [Hylemonella sp.]|uniref:DUF2523 domain-containing protein n=1 Tax=Hylemonella sp. TaxID=2066020 RepID=UPI0022BFEA71|nr:DUF2523 domain-containing protein [Hylemonella sp.]MCZ8252250.1 DUF2523 domain-containing protein [Hylemonella sp.]
MPVFIAAIGGMLLQLVGSLVGRVLLALGLSVVTYSGIDLSLTWLKDQAISSANSLPSELLQLLVFLKVGECISIVTSAVAVRMLWQGMASGSIKRWILK